MTTELPIVAITGATGAVGGQVARTLAARGRALRLLARNPDRAPRLPGSVVMAASYGDRESSEVALAGVRTVFMVSAAESAIRLAEHRAFVDAAVEAGVEHIVYTSFLGAGPDATFTLARDHYATEEYIKETGMGHTFLRDAFYLDFMPALVGADGVIRGPAGDGRSAMVSRADVAAAAVAVLTDLDAHRNRTYELTGPEALTMTEVAQTLTRATGKEITFHDETVPEAYESRRQWNAPQWQLDAWVSTYTAIAAGDMARVSGDVEALTGRPPMSLAEVLAST